MHGIHALIIAALLEASPALAGSLTFDLDGTCTPKLTSELQACNSFAMFGPEQPLVDFAKAVSSGGWPEEDVDMSGAQVVDLSGSPGIPDAVRDLWAAAQSAEKAGDDDGALSYADRAIQAMRTAKPSSPVTHLMITTKQMRRKNLTFTFGFLKLKAS